MPGAVATSAGQKMAPLAAEHFDQKLAQALKQHCTGTVKQFVHHRTLPGNTLQRRAGRGIQLARHASRDIRLSPRQNGMLHCLRHQDRV